MRKKKEKNYARKYARDFNFLTTMYQKYAVFLYRLVFNFFYRFKFEGKKNIKNKESSDNCSLYFFKILASITL